MTTNPMPKAKTERLIVREIDSETLVYDRGRDAASCLNEFCREGLARSPSKITFNESCALDLPISQIAPPRTLKLRARAYSRVWAISKSCTGSTLLLSPAMACASASG